MIYSPTSTFPPLPFLFYPAWTVDLGEGQMLILFCYRAVWSDQEVSVQGNTLSVVTKILKNGFSAEFEVSSVAYFALNLRFSEVSEQSSTG